MIQPRSGSFLNPEGFADKRTYPIGNREAAIREPHVRERDIEKKGFQAQGRGLGFFFFFFFFLLNSIICFKLNK